MSGNGITSACCFKLCNIPGAHHPSPVLPLEEAVSAVRRAQLAQPLKRSLLEIQMGLHCLKAGTSLVLVQRETEKYETVNNKKSSFPSGT